MRDHLDTLLFIGLLLSFGLVGCANVSTTRMTFRSEGRTVDVEMPKELEATAFRLTVDAYSGDVTLSADRISTRNQGTIAAQGEREGALAGKVAEGAAEGAIKGLKGGIP